MRWITLLPGLLLGGCQALAPVAVAGGATVAAIGRSPVDVLASYATGRDCSIVRLDRRESYCAEVEPSPAAEPFCTMSLGRADCWIVPPLAYPAYVPVGDGARPLNAAQEANRTRFGPGIPLPQPLIVVEPATPPLIIIPATPAAGMEPVDSAPSARRPG
ncbi:hypothetical protein [Plastoroseomonas arctica]|uniref:Lipoprotein n=1 Tax=Plastoroseomonas arctica TaxID=1509237 RepID=A0AAF1JW82_9PROT|nr:hypothetical protein [Plastoroseomonas arctica]MBR0654907.1 hypothetical protein [Plastoroseomonas arctica]